MDAPLMHNNSLNNGRTISLQVKQTVHPCASKTLQAAQINENLTITPDRPTEKRGLPKSAAARLQHGQIALPGIGQDNHDQFALVFRPAAHG
jgi:hypothetical protein